MSADWRAELNAIRELKDDWIPGCKSPPAWVCDAMRDSCIGQYASRAQLVSLIPCDGGIDATYQRDGHTWTISIYDGEL